MCHLHSWHSALGRHLIMLIKVIRARESILCHLLGVHNEINFLILFPAHQSTLYLLGVTEFVSNSKMKIFRFTVIKSYTKVILNCREKWNCSKAS